VDNKLALAAAIWVSGFVAGMILVARWLQVGERESSVTAPDVEEPSTPSANKVQRAAERLTGPIAAGARADLLRVRNATQGLRQRVAPPGGASATPSMN
jgi:hypothetical protein